MLRVVIRDDDKIIIIFVDLKKSIRNLISIGLEHHNFFCGFLMQFN